MGLFSFAIWMNAEEEKKRRRNVSKYDMQLIVCGEWIATRQNSFSRVHHKHFQCTAKRVFQIQQLLSIIAPIIRQTHYIHAFRYLCIHFHFHLTWVMMHLKERENKTYNFCITYNYYWVCSNNNYQSIILPDNQQFSSASQHVNALN